MSRAPPGEESLTDVLVARGVAAPPGPEDMRPLAAERCGCLDLHRVEWRRSWLSPDGRRLIWQFRAPDAESVRLALRHSGISFDALWVKP